MPNLITGKDLRRLKDHPMSTPLLQSLAVFTAEELEIHPALGSDHRPVVATWSIR
jgi:hypothetical protein